MQWVRWLAIVLGSGWFIPVSCTSGLAAGTRLVARLDARVVDAGDSLHALFKVAAEPGEGGRAFRVLELAAAQSLDVRSSLDPISFRLSRSRASLQLENATFSYEVLETTPAGQLIELVEETRDGDATVWSRYRAGDKTIEPVSSRLFHVGYMFIALPYAAGGALLLYFAGRLLRRRVDN